MIEAVTEILHSYPQVQPAEVPVRLTKITDYSIDLDLFAYVATADYNEFLRAQTGLFLKFLDAGLQHGVAWAVPISESVTVNPPAASPTAN
jgi:hypothetical protein